MNLIETIFSQIEKDPYKYPPYEDAFSAIRNLESTDSFSAHSYSAGLRAKILPVLNHSDLFDQFYHLYKRTLLFDAPVDFDSFCLYLEINRDPEKRFYQPRRKVLKRMADSLQKLADDQLDELFISCPPRIGKSTILLFFVLWCMGRNTDSSNLYVSFSGIVTKIFYDGVLEVLDDPFTYTYSEIFPKAKKAGTDSKDLLLDLEREKRYKSLTCRSIDGTLNGACDCSGILIADDLISGIDEALSVDRLESKWMSVDNNMLPRAKETAKILWLGTRWSIIDPIAKRQDILKNEEKYKTRRFEIIEIPALNEKDESNFDYAFNLGFSTEYYHQRRASFERNNDMASWDAQYMQKPIERKGALFTSGDMRYFNGVLPEREPDRIFMVVDPAFGGGDYVAAPVCYQYDEDIYIPGVVYNDGDKTVTIPLLGEAAIKYGVTTLQGEANVTIQSYFNELSDWLKKKQYRMTIRTKPAPTNKSKVLRIYDAAPDIREHMIFLASGYRDKSYEMFMQNVFSFKVAGGNKHDDAPDSLCMAINYFKEPYLLQVFKRPF